MASENTSSHPKSYESTLTEEQWKVNGTMRVGAVVDDHKNSDALTKPLGDIGYWEKTFETLKGMRASRVTDDLDLLLSLIECHIYMNSDEIESSVAEVVDFLSKSEPRSATDVRKMAESCYLGKQFLRAIFLHKISHDLHKHETPISPDDELKWIHDRVVDICFAIKPLAEEEGRTRDFAKSHGLKQADEMMKDFKEVRNASANLRTIIELDYLVKITHVYIELMEDERCSRFAEEGVTMVKQQFRENASDFKNYGTLLQNVGTACHNLGQYEKAEQYFLAAIEAKSKALDYGNGTQRREDIEMSKFCRKVNCEYLNKSN